MIFQNIFKYFIFLFMALAGCNKEKIASSELEMKVINDVFMDVVVELHIYQELDDFKKEYYQNHTDSISSFDLSVLYYKNRKIIKEGILLLPDLLTPMKKEYFDLYSKNFSYVYSDIYGKLPTDSIAELKANRIFDIKRIINFSRYKILKRSENKAIESEEGVFDVRFSRVYFYENNQKALFVYEYSCWDGSGMCHVEDLYFVSLNSDGKWVVDKIHNLIVV